MVRDTIPQYGAAAEYLKSFGVTRRDEIELLPKGFKGFWINNPANIIHLVSQDEGKKKREGGALILGFPSKPMKLKTG